MDRVRVVVGTWRPAAMVPLVRYRKREKWVLWSRAMVYL